MPDRFVLEVAAKGGGWIDYGLFERGLFERLDDGSYVCSGDGGAPLRLRCVRQSDEEVEVLDSDGRHRTYRLVPIPEPSLPPHRFLTTVQWPPMGL